MSTATPKPESIFSFDDYKAYLREHLQTRGKLPGYKSRLARAMGTPQSFVSQVLHAHAHLSADHALKLARFWGFNESERDYLLDLVALVRASTSELQALIRKRLEAIKRRGEDLASRFSQPQVESANQWLYYTGWQYGAVHMLLTIPRMRSEEAIARRLGIEADQVRATLEVLERMGLAARKGATWEATKHSIHLPKDSPASPANHQVWRNRAAQDMLAPKGTSLHYTGLHTLSRRDVPRLRAILLDALESGRELIGPSSEEELVCLSLDLFEV